MMHRTSFMSTNHRGSTVLACSGEVKLPRRVASSRAIAESPVAERQGKAEKAPSTVRFRLAPPISLQNLVRFERSFERQNPMNCKTNVKNT
jgi:hypothetical protein